MGLDGELKVNAKSKKAATSWHFHFLEGPPWIDGAPLLNDLRPDGLTGTGEISSVPASLDLADELDWATEGLLAGGAQGWYRSSDRITNKDRICPWSLGLMRRIIGMRSESGKVTWRVLTAST